jgi:hypothetical protein
VEDIAIAKIYGVGASSYSYSQISSLFLVSLFVVGHEKLRRENIYILGNIHTVEELRHLVPKLFSLRVIFGF